MSESTAAVRANSPEASFSLWQRILLAIVPPVARGLLLLLGRTLRYEVTGEEPEGRAPAPGSIGVIWHRYLLVAAHYYRWRNVTIMISSSFDGELITRTVQGMGYSVVRGSSRRGAVQALLGMHHAEGFRAFTADGPKGPAFVAKPGPVLLARNTGGSIYCIGLAPREAWELGSWDRMLIPKPFTRVHVRLASRIEVPGTADADQMRACLGQMQTTLERVRAEAERRISGH